ncbi:MAG: hypothetical protein SXA11_26160, partial [Cyanobacteriota bacterium]|nr:hypothetical protein [Cyanobacteriota bacterium]
MSNFWKLFGKGQSKKDGKSAVPSDESSDSFILEPILTPSGLVDGSDDSSDLAIADIDIDDGQLEEIEVPPVEVEDIADTAEAGDIEDIEEIPFVEDGETVLEVEDVEVLDSEIENIEFFTDLEETAEGENGSNFDDLVNSNVVDPNETELTATNIEES